MTPHGRNDLLPFYLDKDLAFLSLVSFSKICTPISQNGIIKQNYQFRSFSVSVAIIYTCPNIIYLLEILRLGVLKYSG